MRDHLALTSGSILRARASRSFSSPTLDASMDRAEEEENDEVEEVEDTEEAAEDALARGSSSWFA